MIPLSRRSFSDRTRKILVPACAMLVAFASSPVWSHGGGFHGGGGGGFHGGGGSFHGGGGMPKGGANFGGARPSSMPSRGGMSRPTGGARPAGGAGGLGKTGGGVKGTGGHFAGDPLAHSGLSANSLRSLGRGGASTHLKAQSIQNLDARGSQIRNNFYNGNWYGGRGWYANNFGRWWPGGWYGGWGGWGLGLASGLLWADLAGWGGYGAQPIAYDYGTTVVYSDDAVTVAGEDMGTPEEYSQSATDLAASGAGDDAAGADSEWRPLGVYALARDGESKPSTFISLAVDADGVLRGNYYDAISDSSKEITGKVDSQTQRAAWTIGDNKANVYEAGLSNLLKDQTQVLVHRNNEDGTATGNVEQMLLVRVDDGDEKTS